MVVGDSVKYHDILWLELKVKSSPPSNWEARTIAYYTT